MFKRFIHKIYTFIVYINFYFSKKKFKKYIFIHPAQSGGNTIDYFFKINFGLRNFKINNHFDFDIFDFSSTKLDKYFLLFGHFPYEFAIRSGYEKNYYYFTSIRNPKDRYLSNYFRNKTDYEKKGDTYMSLENFLKERINQGLDNYYVRFFSSKKIYADKSITIHEDHYKDSLENLKKLNFIFFIDEMRRDLNDFKKNFKLIFDMAFLFNLHKNKVSNSNYRKLSAVENDLLYKLTVFDLKLYDAIKKFKNR
tara:strand:+ start:371 stop:1126 length:756 start_codon:yes stop_codon:yes gene_type:complete